MNIAPRFNWITLEKIRKRDGVGPEVFTSATVVGFGESICQSSRISVGNQILFRDSSLRVCEGVCMIRYPDIVGRVIE